MAEGRHAGVSRETWIDRQIREATERGEFDDLPGAGKPLPDLDRPRDDLWWVKNLMRRESLSITPPLLELRKAREDALRRVARARSEDEVRRIVTVVNDRIIAFNAKANGGPPSDVMPLEEKEVLRSWRQGRA